MIDLTEFFSRANIAVLLILAVMLLMYLAFGKLDSELKEGKSSRKK